MNKELSEVRLSDSFIGMCARMGAFLGLSREIPKNAMLRAIEDADFANDLIISRNSPGFLDVLINDPKNTEYATRDDSNKEVDKAVLLKNATNAITRWAKAGFSVVDEQTLLRREDACLACKYLIKPVDVLQKIVTSKPQEIDGKRAADCVCRICGCSISKKIRIPTESCPDKHSEISGINRWGEQMKE